MTKIGFTLDKINTEQFAIIESSYDDCNEEFGLEASLKFGVNSENSAIISYVKFQFEQNNIPFLIIETSCEFTIDEKFWANFSTKESIIIPKGFLSHLAMITTGTTRGILHSKTENTKFNEFLLPTINITEMITDDGEFEK